MGLQFTDCKPQKNYSAATAFPGLPSLVICDFIASDERAKEKGPPTKAPLLLAMDPTWKENSSKPLESGGVRQAHPDQPCETIVARRAKNVKPSFAVAHSGRLPLPTYLPGLSRPELRKPLLPRLKWKGARLPDGTHRGGPSQRLGGAARQPALRSPGAPSGGGRGGGGSRGEQGRAKRRPNAGQSEAKDEEGQAGEDEGRAPQGSTAAPREGRGTATDKKRPGALSPKPGFAGLCPGAGACRRFRRGITHHCRQETLVRGSGFGPGKRRHLKHPAQGRLCRLLCPCAGC